jgi:hypothetical protein
VSGKDDFSSVVLSKVRLSTGVVEVRVSVNVDKNDASLEIPSDGVTDAAGAVLVCCDSVRKV